MQISKFEGLGLTVIETKILQSLIVTTNFSIASEILDDNITGLIVRLTREEIAQGMLCYINDTKLCNKVRENLSKEKLNQFEFKRLNVMSIKL